MSILGAQSHYTIEYRDIDCDLIAVRGPFRDYQPAREAFSVWPRLTPGDSAYLCLGEGVVDYWHDDRPV